MKHWLIAMIFMASLFSDAVARDFVKTEKSAAYDESSAEDEAELNRLMTIIEKHTEIATKTKLNADFVPGIVTVLYGDDLEARGIRNVGEALCTVPGIDISVHNIGGKGITVRGITENFFSGNTKLLLDGVSMNVILYADAYGSFRIPIEQVERIEVIRGPGSAIHGEFAYTSVINIITRKQGSRVWGTAGSFESYQGGGLISWADRKNDFRLSLNAALLDTEGADVQSGPDILYSMGMKEFSHAPGKVNESQDFKTVFVTMTYKQTEFIGKYLNGNQGDAFGISNALPFPDHDKNIHSAQYFAEARHHFDFSPSFFADIRFGWMRHTLNYDRMMLFPSGFLGIYADGMIGGFQYEEYRQDGGIDMTWKGWERHALFMSLSFADIWIGDVWAESNFNTATLEPLPSVQQFRGDRNIFAEDSSRLLRSVTFQDEFQANDDVTLTAGLRYDSYDDVGESVSPRLAGVWRVSEQHIIKAQYARAFRPPTFSEMYSLNNPVVRGNPNIRLSDIGTYEVGYIYKGIHRVNRLTAFYSKLTDMVIQEPDKTINNSGRARLHGVELEHEQELASYLRLTANLSYVNAEDMKTGKQIAGSPNWLGNAGLLYTPRDKVALSLQYRYVRNRNRSRDDIRDELSAYHTADITGSIFNCFFKGLSIRAGIKNLFDADIRDPASEGTYPEDYPRPGREWWTQISYVF